MMRVYPVIRSTIESVLKAADPFFDPMRLTLGGRFHASYFAGDSADELAASAACGFARVDALNGFVNFSLSADFIGGFTTAFLCALPPVALHFDLAEDELFSPVLYAAARLHQLTLLTSIVSSCPEEDAAKDALFALYGLAEYVENAKLTTKANQAAAQLLSIVQSIPSNESRMARLSEFSGVLAAGARTMFYIYTQLPNRDPDRHPLASSAEKTAIPHPQTKGCPS